LQCKGLVKSAASGELNAEGEDLIVAAAADGWSADDIKTLIQAGADAAAVDKDGNKAFVVAAGNGHLLTMQALLVGGCDLGRALLRAAANGHVDCVEALISSGADVATSNV
jgi:ankyrin repeat protein